MDKKKPAAKSKAAGKKNSVKTRKRSTGWARTKEYPHKRHPAYYRKQQGDNIEYVTFTHSDAVDLGKEKVPTKKLNKNIDYKNKGENRYSHVLPRVYEGERSALGKGTNDFKLDKSDKATVDKIFATGKRYPVPRPGGKDKSKKSDNQIGHKKRK